MRDRTRSPRGATLPVPDRRWEALMPDLSPTIYLLIGWALVQAAIVGFAVLGSRRRPSEPDGFSGDPRIRAPDRRTVSRERRVGLPDLREPRTERRRDSVDRREGAADRRRAPPATA